MLDQSSCIVSGSVIYDDNSVVAVVLVEDRLEVVLIPKVFGIVEAWHHNAEGKLRCIITKMIRLFETSFFLL